MITKRTQPQVKNLIDIREGRDKKFFFCEGAKLIEDVLGAGIDSLQCFCSKEHEGKIKEKLKSHIHGNIPLTLLSDDVMSFVSDLDTPPGVIFIGKRPSQVSVPLNKFQDNPLILFLHQIQLPQNVGALLRTAEAAGVKHIILTRGTADPFQPKSIRASAGSVFRHIFHSFESIEKAMELLNQSKVQTYATHQDGEKNYAEIDWTTPSALLLGNEGQGLKDSERSFIKNSVKIPMSGKVDSLNVGIAGAICLFEAARQRKFKV